MQAVKSVEGCTTIEGACGQLRGRRGESGEGGGREVRAVKGARAVEGGGSQGLGFRGRKAVKIVEGVKGTVEGACGQLQG